MLAWLIAGHLFGDFLLQNRWMADNKAKKIIALLIHSAVYTTAVWLTSLPMGGLKLWSLAIILVCHAVIDNRKFVFWWCKHITKSEPIVYLAHMTDQAWHIAVLVLVCLVDKK